MNIKTHHIPVTLFVSALTFNMTCNAQMLAQDPDKVVAASQQKLKDTAQQKVKALGTQLKQALSSAIQSKGLLHAIDVCHQQAPLIAQQLSTDGWTVARTSLKTRNPNNSPDSWETENLIAFDQAYKEGQPLSSLNVSDSDENEYRFMQAIATDQVCLACHGSAVAPAVLKAISTHYPSDQATGYTLDDIRGAFSVSKSLSNE